MAQRSWGCWAAKQKESATLPAHPPIQSSHHSYPSTRCLVAVVGCFVSVPRSWFLAAMCGPAGCPFSHVTPYILLQPASGLMLAPRPWPCLHHFIPNIDASYYIMDHIHIQSQAGRMQLFSRLLLRPCVLLVCRAVFGIGQQTVAFYHVSGPLCILPLMILASKCVSMSFRDWVRANTPNRKKVHLLLPFLGIPDFRAPRRAPAVFHNWP